MFAEPGRIICEIHIYLGKLNMLAFIEVFEWRKEGIWEKELRMPYAFWFYHFATEHFHQEWNTRLSWPTKNHMNFQKEERCSRLRQAWIMCLPSGKSLQTNAGRAKFCYIRHYSESGMCLTLQGIGTAVTRSALHRPKSWWKIFPNQWW